MRTALQEAVDKRTEVHVTPTATPKRKLPNESDRCESVDLTMDDEEDGLPTPTPAAKRKRMTASKASNVTPANDRQDEGLSSPYFSAKSNAHSQSSPAAAPTATSLPTRTIPTPSPTPQKPKAAEEDGSNQPTVYDVPETPARLADRYVPKTCDGVDYVKPQKFCLKPPYWMRWTLQQYQRLADAVSFDAVAFARAEGITVQEAQNVFNAVVTRPLQKAGEATRRGEEGMQEIFYLHNQCGEPARPWTLRQGDEKIVAELAGFKDGSIVLILQNGIEEEIEVCKLSDGDIGHLKKTLTKKERQTLWPPRLKEATQERKWTGRNKGQKVARLIDVKAGVVVLRLENEKKLEFPVGVFCDTDLEYLKRVLTDKGMEILWPKE